MSPSAGAGLLLQLAITRFFDCKPERRGEGATYPEFYVFHVGGPHGDFSHFDFWPPRKEVRVPAGDPLALLETINSHAITVIALPEGKFGPLSALEDGPSSWAEQGSARDRIHSAFTYSAKGAVDRSDFEISTSAPPVRENIDGTIDIMSSVRAVRESVAAAGTVSTGVMGDADNLRWGEVVETRVTEVPADAFARAAGRMQACVDSRTGALSQHYARLSPGEALERIAGFAAR